ncbi:HIT family protein [Streptomyces sp. NPDC127584]|uniref:HIT family protein n=1 Tax=Streptomyces sp. NPDC127584 TaxID=3345403 RepID=UPI0036326AA9
MTNDEVESCPFCAIVNGSAPAHVVHEDSTTMAIVPRHPATTGHVLVIPKEHAADAWSISRRDFTEVNSSAWLVAQAVRKALNPPGLNIISSTGEVATQTVFHLHVHVVPRWAGDAVNLEWPHGSTPLDFTREEVAETLRHYITSERTTKPRLQD